MDPFNVSKRIVNPNTSGYGHETDQHALHVVQDHVFGNNGFSVRTDNTDLNLDVLGICDWGTSTYKLVSPVSCTKSIVFTDSIADYVRVIANSLDSRRQTALTQAERAEAFQRIQNETAVHEMGHNVGLQHHSPTKSGDARCFMRYVDNSRNVSGMAPWADIFTRLQNCAPNESCWGQIQVSDADTDIY